MTTARPLPQPGVLALGTSAQAFLELDLEPGADPQAARAAMAEICEGLLTGMGCNVVGGFRPELWHDLAPDHSPPGTSGFTEAVRGPDGFTMPATQHDLLVWVSAGGRDVVFDESRAALDRLAGIARLAEETEGWTYHRHLDLTGFEDGTENPTLGEAGEVCFVADGPGIASTVLLLQKWLHDTDAWGALGTHGQEQAMGRTKAGSVELDDKPASSHVARTDQDEVGHVVRRNLPYGGVTEHGTVFVGLCRDQQVLADMLTRMAGADGGPRDELTRYTSAVTGAYYVLPAATAL